MRPDLLKVKTSRSNLGGRIGTSIGCLNSPLILCAASQPSWSGRAGAIRAVIAATKTIPIVVSFGGDPVKLGYVASLNHPDGNVTGVSVFSTDLEAKRLELINEVVPQGEIIGYLSDPESSLLTWDGARWRPPHDELGETFGSWK